VVGRRRAEARAHPRAPRRNQRQRRGPLDDDQPENLAAAELAEDTEIAFWDALIVAAAAAACDDLLGEDLRTDGEVLRVWIRNRSPTWPEPLACGWRPSTAAGEQWRYAGMQAENSDERPGSTGTPTPTVATAVTNWPAGTAASSVVLPVPGASTVEPTSVSPSPLPDGSHVADA
jgi:hypothetical protein